MNVSRSPHSTRATLAGRCFAHTVHYQDEYKESVRIHVYTCISHPALAITGGDSPRSVRSRRKSGSRDGTLAEIREIQDTAIRLFGLASFKGKQTLHSIETRDLVKNAGALKSCSYVRTSIVYIHFYSIGCFLNSRTRDERS